MIRTALALSIIRYATPAAHREFVVGDTLERATEIERSHGAKAAKRRNALCAVCAVMRLPGQGGFCGSPQMDIILFIINR